MQPHYFSSALILYTVGLDDEWEICDVFVNPWDEE